MTPDFRPQPLLENKNASDFPFTVTLTLDKTEEGCHYLAHVKHASAQSQKQHQEMGFEAGWGAAFDQLIEILKESPKLI